MQNAPIPMPPVRAICLLLSCLLVSACATSELSRIKENYSGISPKYIHFGNRLSAVIQATRPIIHDRVLTNYLLHMKKTLLAPVKVARVPGRIYVMDDRSVYAFCVPNGDIFLSKGMLALARNDSELASVIGHELGHILLGYFREVDKQQTKIAKALFQSGTGSTHSQDETNAAFWAVLYFGNRREDELAADRVMLQLQEPAGYDPCGVQSMFRKLVVVTQQAYGATAKTQLFDTHPATPERLRLIEEQLRSKGCDSKHPATSESYRLNVLDRLPRG